MWSISHGSAEPFAHTPLASRSIEFAVATARMVNKFPLSAPCLHLAPLETRDQCKLHRSEGLGVRQYQGSIQVTTMTVGYGAPTIDGDYPHASHSSPNTAASAPSLRARNSVYLPMARSQDMSGGNVKVVVRVRKFLPRGTHRTKDKSKTEPR